MIENFALRIDQRTFFGPFVIDAGDSGLADHGACGGQRLVNLQPLLTMHQLYRVNAGGRISHPETGITQHHRLGGGGLQIFFIDKAKLIWIQRIGPITHAERIEHGVAFGVGVNLLFDLPIKNGLIIHHLPLRLDPS